MPNRNGQLTACERIWYYRIMMYIPMQYKGKYFVAPYDNRIGYLSTKGVQTSVFKSMQVKEVDDDFEYCTNYTRLLIAYRKLND